MSIQLDIKLKKHNKVYSEGVCISSESGCQNAPNNLYTGLYLF